MVYSQEVNQTTMESILIAEAGRYPEMELNDLYKFIHQAAFGSEHAIRDTAFVRKWLENEIKGLDFSITEPLKVVLSPDGQMVRINLRPWIQMGYNTDILLNAFILTANSQITSSEKFSSFRECARKLVENNLFRFSVKDFDEFFSQKESENFPAIHHSKRYEELYAPAYRVIDLKYLPGNY